MRKYQGRAQAALGKTCPQTDRLTRSVLPPRRGADVGSTRRQISDSKFGPRLSGPDPWRPLTPPSARSPHPPRRDRAGGFTRETTTSPLRPSTPAAQRRARPSRAEAAAGPEGGPRTPPGPRKMPAPDRAAAGAGLA